MLFKDSLGFKFEELSIFITLMTHVEKHLNRKIIAFHSNNGKEYKSFIPVLEQCST